jgi:colanic acid/amylovoran biosynthesis glycosyltransferase
MRLCYLISQYPAVSHTFVQREILGLRKLGWDITTISIRRPRENELLTETDKSEAAGTQSLLPTSSMALLAAAMVIFTSPVRFFRAFKSAWRLRRPGVRGALWAMFYLAEALLVHRITARSGITHFHAHFANVACDVAMIASVLSDAAPRATFSFTMHGPTEFFDLAHHRLAEKTRAARFVICISDFARSQLMALLPPNQWDKLQVVHCGVDPEQFAHPQVKSEKATSRSLLTIARLAPVKGHAVLFRALDELILRGHDVTLTLAGDGPSRSELEQLADELGLRGRIHFAGNIGQDRIPQMLSNADLFVLPSFAEGVPVVLMEAMAAGCPVIATRIAGIPELIEDHHNGLLVPPGRHDLLANAIERLLAAPALAQRLAMEARLKIELDFNLHTTSARLSSILKQQLGPRRTAIAARNRGTDAAPLLTPDAKTDQAAAATRRAKEPLP